MLNLSVSTFHHAILTQSSENVPMFGPKVYVSKYMSLQRKTDLDLQELSPWFFICAVFILVPSRLVFRAGCGIDGIGS